MFSPFLVIVIRDFHTVGGIVKIQWRYYLILFQVVFSSLPEIPCFWKLYIMFRCCWSLESVLSHSHSMSGLISVINFLAVVSWSMCVQMESTVSWLRINKR